jgi:histone deacetylase 6
MNKKIGLVYDPVMTLHISDPYNSIKYIESPDRIFSIYHALLDFGYVQKMFPIKSREITRNELLELHDENYINNLEYKLSGPKGLIKQIAAQYKNDIYVNKYTLQCAKLAAGSSIELIIKIAQREILSGVALVRPPGHHACRSKAMGFCFYNNVALSAKVASRYYQRILIIDWDIHYGNGTVELLQGHPNIFYISLHRYDNGNFFPGNGHPGKEHNIYNICFDSISGDEEYIDAFIKYVIPTSKEYDPQIILISAGFDAAEGDPLGGYKVTPAGFYQMTKMLKNICPHIAIILEGGYNLSSTSDCMVECVNALFD